MDKEDHYCSFLHEAESYILGIYAGWATSQSCRLPLIFTFMIGKIKRRRKVKIVAWPTFPSTLWLWTCDGFEFFIPRSSPVQHSAGDQNYSLSLWQCKNSSSAAECSWQLEWQALGRVINSGTLVLQLGHRTGVFRSERLTVSLSLRN